MKTKPDFGGVYLTIGILAVFVLVGYFLNNPTKNISDNKMNNSKNIENQLPGYLDKKISEYREVYGYDMLEDNDYNNAYHFNLRFPAELKEIRSGIYKIVYLDSEKQEYSIVPRSILFGDITKLRKNLETTSKIESVFFPESSIDSIWETTWSYFELVLPDKYVRYYFTDKNGLRFGFIIELPKNNKNSYIKFTEKILSTFQTTSYSNTNEFMKSFFKK